MHSRLCDYLIPKPGNNLYQKKPETLVNDVAWLIKMWNERELGLQTGVANSGAHSVSPLEEQLNEPRSYESRSTRHTHDPSARAHPPQSLSLSLLLTPTKRRTGKLEIWSG